MSSCSQDANVFHSLVSRKSDSKSTSTIVVTETDDECTGAAVRLGIDELVMIYAISLAASLDGLAPIAIENGPRLGYDTLAFRVTISLSPTQTSGSDSRITVNEQDVKAAVVLNLGERIVLNGNVERSVVGGKVVNNGILRYNMRLE
ncbi:hypothetical protein G7Y89_g15291 [Cudoniella acicularis]|uniref:Uncharacterized protein n=1 Tax=Cudoniella acicularis TaxID=354080 RepID=A0A8H4VN02_9HELO|nr:hypothetical protein G7Y89_g15291 [Cudoniella acicularis]